MESFGHVYGAGLRQTRDVVAQQVENHQVFGAVFLVIGQCVGDARGFFGRCAQRRGAFHRAGAQLQSVQLKE